MNTQPVLLTPAFKDYLWGGTKLRTEYNKQCDLNPIAESWELSAHKDGQSTVASGPDKGLVFCDYIEKHGKEILGANCQAFERFPILIKFIDAKQALSVQVHPSDEYALEHEGEYGKTEVWYVMSADEGASLYYGTNTEISREELCERIRENTITDVLNRVEAKAGDVFFIEPGTIHAIGAGLMICEIQQNSNTTYRVYDYDRRGADGKPRELHIDKAIAVSTLTPSHGTKCGEAQVLDGYTSSKIASCKYFTSEQITVTDTANIKIYDDSFRSVVVCRGEASLSAGGCTLSVKKGDSVFVPAQNGCITVNGSCELLLSYV